MVIEKNKTKSKFTDLSGDCVQMNKHEGIIRASKWLAVQYELDKNKPITNSGKGKNTWLTGLTKCGFCGLHISVVGGQRNGKRYINCGGRKANFCFERTVTLTFDGIEKVVKESLFKHIQEYEFVQIEREQNNTEKENQLKIELIKIEEEINSLMDKLSNANETLFQYINNRIVQLDQNKKEIEKQIAENREQRIDISNPELLQRALTDWENFSFEEKKYIARLFIDKIIIYNDKIDIIYK